MGLTLEQDKELYHLMKKGDINARDKLIMSVQDIVTYHANNIAFDRFVYDDLVGEGNLALVKCVEKWQYIGKPFKNYAWQWVRLSMLKYLQRKRKIFRDKDPEFLFFDHDDVSELIELSNDGDITRTLECDNILDTVCKVLTKRQAQIIRLMYHERLNIREISEKLNISYTTVGTTIMNARERVQQHFTKEDLGW